ncbi:hypothetical protein QFW77_11265 [Luteimonas sp. RD2P54]|uniref:Uncharacterized protein n=1 Tax=Luteimonas endophytica TaxID=3042023 RepID=A0ABT6JAF8_9GAMM|nr:hypothetical protein [Luteimonas endophytica]MDH5823565.1 hypothetical protein [Luteimonas endophytica]
MALHPLELLLLLRGLSRPPPPATRAGTGPTATPPTATTQEPSMANEFEFLDKHYDPTDIPEVAAQTAFERFGNFPNAHTSTVIFNIPWQTLTNAINQAVLTYVNGGVASGTAAATLSANGQQWNIVLTGLQYVNATRTMVQGRPQYSIDEYRNGSVFVNAEAIGGQLLGEVVHLSTGFGTWVQTLELKNPPTL